MMVEKVDVLICGSGSAGLCAAVWLARHGVICKILEKRSGPMQFGQADVVQCRTVEIFESLGIAEELLREYYHVLEVAFWASDGECGIVRTSRTMDTNWTFTYAHVILNQARINELLIETTERFNRPKTDYNYDVKTIKVDSIAVERQNAYPATVVAEKNGVEEIFTAKYVLACDGAHSNIHRSPGFKIVGDTSEAVWGVMDVYPQTDLPDIRKKVTIRSEYGSLLIIPREGGSLVLFYIEMPSGTQVKDVTPEGLHESAQRIFHPHTIEIAETFWWSTFVIGQRLADHFSKNNRVFLTGDSCHTQSPKAGQSMNTSLQDGYNIGWKLELVLKGQAGPGLLKTYVLERQKVARDLIDFDRYFSKLFSSEGNMESASPQHFNDQFIKSERYTAGLTATYDDSIITSAGRSTQDFARNITAGMRFLSA